MIDLLWLLLLIGSCAAAALVIALGLCVEPPGRPVAPIIVAPMDENAEAA